MNLSPLLHLFKKIMHLIYACECVMGVEVSLRVWIWVYVKCFIFSDRVFHQVSSLSIQLVYLTSEPLVFPFPPPMSGL